MASKREIKRRVVAVKNTSKITRAMKLVSAAKLRKAQEAVHNTRGYTNAMAGMVARLMNAGGDDFSNPLLETRAEVKRRRVLVVGGSRGLCGSYNSNVNRTVERFLKEGPGRDGQNEFFILGKKPAEYFRRTRREVLKSWEELPEDATKWPIAAVAQALTDDFVSGQVDEVWILYTKFKSAISMNAIFEQLLPLTRQALIAPSATTSANNTSIDVPQTSVTVFEPSPARVLAALLPRLVQAKILQASLDAKASEYGSRMTAMEAATKNANELGRKLSLLYNRLRQAGITGDLLDIVNGAEAMK